MYLYTGQGVQGNKQIPEQGCVGAAVFPSVWLQPRPWKVCGVAALSSPCLRGAWHSDRPAPLEHSLCRAQPGRGPGGEDWGWQ